MSKDETIAMTFGLVLFLPILADNKPFYEQGGGKI